MTVAILVTLFSLSAVLPAVSQDGLDESPRQTSGRALVDFAVTGISVGNGTSPTSTWTQPDTSTVDYILATQAIELNVTYQQAGQDFSTKTAVATIEVWHPIGFQVTAWSFNLTLSGGQTGYRSVEWTADAAHSILDESGTLSGGYIIRGTVDAGTLDNNEANDVYDETLPIAVYSSATDDAVCGDPDGDGTVNCPNQLMAGVPQWVSGGYDAADVGDNLGHWQTDSGGAVGSSRHLRVSTPGASSYAAARNDRMHMAWFIAGQQAGCDDPGHGLGYGQYNDFLTQTYGNTVCTVQIQGFDYISLQAYTMAWGDMGQGDQMQLEANTGIDKAVLNLTEAGVSTVADDWTPVIWNMTDVFPNTNFGFNLRFQSDNLGATLGMRLDTLHFFGVEKVAGYTVDLSCDDPTPNPYVVIPADPNPPSLLCNLTNNGYNTIHLTIRTEVDKADWMATYPLRIDSSNIIDHDNTVSIEPIETGESTEFWVNLTIPEGADVQTVNWSIWLNDTQTGYQKEEMHLTVNVDSSFSAQLRQTTLANPAATLAPGEVANISMKLRNTGNQQATWALGGYFGDESWGSGNLDWFDSNGGLVNAIQINRSEEVELVARFTAPMDSVPGTIEVSLVANGVAPAASAQAIRKIYLEVPVVRDLILTPQSSDFEASANAQTRTISVTLTNHGNSEQAYNLSLQADWRLLASTSISATNPLAPFGGTTTVLVVLPMPYGLTPDVYPMDVVASSTDGSQYTASTQIMLTVPMTYEVEVEDLDMSAQTFKGGEDAKTVGWQITNLGNDQDAFNISSTQTDGMHVEFLSLTDGRTPYIVPGESYELILRYWFDKEKDGEKTLVLTASSVEAGAVGLTSSASGSATFQVGSQGWVTLESTGPVIIDDYGRFEAQMQIHNRHPVDEQQIRLDVERDSQFFGDGFSASIETSEFALGPDGERLITIEIRVFETALINMPSEVITYNITIEAVGGLDVVEAKQQVTIHRIVVVDEAEESSLFSSVIRYVGMGIGSIAIIALLVVFVQVIRSTVRIEDEIITLEGYETSLGATYGQAAPPPAAIPEAPSLLPASDLEANSMYGGSEAIFKQRVGAPEAPADPATAAAGPPLPASGLPEGWTMDQWQHYGQQWLEQNGLA